MEEQARFSTNNLLVNVRWNGRGERTRRVFFFLAKFRYFRQRNWENFANFFSLVRLIFFKKNFGLRFAKMLISKKGKNKKKRRRGAQVSLPSNLLVSYSLGKVCFGASARERECATLSSSSRVHVACRQARLGCAFDRFLRGREKPAGRRERERKRDRGDTGEIVSTKAERRTKTKKQDGCVDTARLAYYYSPVFVGRMVP